MMPRTMNRLEVNGAVGANAIVTGKKRGNLKFGNSKDSLELRILKQNEIFETNESIENSKFPAFAWNFTIWKTIG